MSQIVGCNPKDIAKERTVAPLVIAFESVRGEFRPPFPFFSPFFLLVGGEGVWFVVYHTRTDEVMADVCCLFT